MSANGADRSEMAFDREPFARALRTALVQPGDEDFAARLVPRLAEAARMSTPASSAPETASARPRRRKIALRIGACVAAVPLATAGLAVAGVNLPGPADEAFEKVGINLPNQGSDDASPAGDRGEGQAKDGSAGDGKGAGRDGTKPDAPGRPDRPGKSGSSQGSKGDGSNPGQGRPDDPGKSGSAPGQNKPSKGAATGNGSADGNAGGNGGGNAVGKTGTPPGQAKAPAAPPGQAKKPETPPAG